VTEIHPPGLDRRDRIELRGLRALGTHGVLPEERDRPQPFEVDLDLEVDLRSAGRSDDLSDTVDYGAVAEAVAAVIAGPHADLLEHLAERMARAAFGAVSSTDRVDAARLTGVTVAVRKLRPPVGVDMTSAGVCIFRRPDGPPKPGDPDDRGQQAGPAHAP
jgi:dihydroneopterin aldolase